MPVLVPGVCGQAARSVRGLPMTCSAAYPKSSSASSFQALMAPVRSIWTTATRTRPSASGSRAEGRAGPAARVPTERSGSSSWNQTCLWVGVYSTPQRPARAAQSWRPRPPSRSGLPMLMAVRLEWDLTFRVAVRHLDPYAVVAAQAQDVGGRARVHHGVGDQFTGEDHGVVDDVGEAPALEGVTDEGASGRDGPPDRVEAGGRARGDHRTPCPVVGVQGCRGRPAPAWAGAGSPSAGDPGVVPQDAVRWSWCGAPPMPARSCSCHRPGRKDRRGWTAACKVTYLHRPCGCRSQ